MFTEQALCRFAFNDRFEMNTPLCEKWWSMRKNIQSLGSFGSTAYDPVRGKQSTRIFQFARAFGCASWRLSWNLITFVDRLRSRRLSRVRFGRQIEFLKNFFNSNSHRVVYLREWRSKHQSPDSIWTTTDTIETKHKHRRTENERKDA